MVPLFVCLALACLIPLLAGQALLLPLLGLALAGAVLAAVVAQWLRHPAALHDRIQGGVVGIVRDDTQRLRWQDWEIALSRFGELDRRRRRIRIERRLLCGLIPWDVQEHALDEFYRVDLTWQEPGLERLELRRPSGQHVLALDLIALGPEQQRQARAMTVYIRDQLAEEVEPARRAQRSRETGLAARLERAIASPLAPRRPPAPCQVCRGAAANEAQRRRDHLAALAGTLGAGRVVRTARDWGCALGQRADRLVAVSAVVGLRARPDGDLTRFSLDVASPLAFQARRPRGELRANPAAGGPGWEWSGLASAPWAATALQPLLARLFDQLGLDELTLESGRLWAEKAADPDDLCLARVEELLDALEQVARLVEAGGPRLVERLVARESKRCPFCRDDFLEADEVVACEQCGTPHHAECLEELGRCTVQGCAGRRGSRAARSRA